MGFFSLAWRWRFLPESSHDPFSAYCSAVQLLSCVGLFTTLCIATCQASLSLTISQSLLKLMSIELVLLSNHLILCYPLLLLPSVFASIKVFSSESALRIRGPKAGVSASTSVLPMNTQDWFSLGWTGWISLQFKGLSSVFSNTTVQKHQFFWKKHSAFFIIQLSHPYMTTRKTRALTILTFVSFIICCVALSELFFQGASVF